MMEEQQTISIPDFFTTLAFNVTTFSFSDFRLFFKIECTYCYVCIHLRVLILNIKPLKITKNA